jgi:hypothetical protein
MELHPSDRYRKPESLRTFNFPTPITPTNVNLQESRCGKNVEMAGSSDVIPGKRLRQSAPGIGHHQGHKSDCPKALINVSK